MKGKSFCPICKCSLDAELKIGLNVLLQRDCPQHGPIETIIYSSVEYYNAALNSPKNPNAMKCLVVEVTQRCSVGCKTCSASSLPGGSDKSISSILSEIRDAKQVYNLEAVAISGGEPLMREDLLKLLDEVHHLISKVVLITSGTGFENSQYLINALGERKAWLEIYLQFDSLRDEVLHTLRSDSISTEIRKARLRAAVNTGLLVTPVCVVADGINSDEVPSLVRYAMEEGANGITFQPLRQLGRFPNVQKKSDEISTVDCIQRLALEASGISAEEPSPLNSQPFDLAANWERPLHKMSLQGLFSDANSRGFRIVTSSYWDHSNYFSTLINNSPHYFLIRSGSYFQPLNVHYLIP